MFSVVTTIYHKKKPERPTLMELFIAAGKLKRFLFSFDNYRCSMCVPQVTRHTSIQCSSSCHTRVNMGTSIFFTAAMIRGFGSARSCRRVLCVLCTKCTLHITHRITRVIFQHTKRLLPRSGHFLTTHTHIA